MASRSERIKLLAQAIGADIKKAFADASAALLKAQGIEEYGFNAPAKRLAAGTDLNNLPVKSARYRAQRADNILNLPSELYTYVHNYEFILDVITGDPLDYDGYLPKNQTLTVAMFPPEGTSSSNIVVFARSHNYLGFTQWQRITGEIYGVDVGGDVVGDDAVFNTIQVGATSPKIGFEIIRSGITYKDFGYEEDGITAAGGYDNRGVKYLQGTRPAKDVILTKFSMFAKPYGILERINSGGFDGYYNTVADYGYFYGVNIKTLAHAIEVDSGNPQSGQSLFNDATAYMELFVIYKVD